MVLHCHNCSLLLSSFICSIWVSTLLSFFRACTVSIWAFVILALLIVFLLILILHLLLKPFKLLLEMYVLNQLMLSAFYLFLRKLWLSRFSKLEYSLRLSFNVFGLFMLEARVAHECCLRQFIPARKLPFKRDDLSVLCFSGGRWEVFNVAETFRMQFTSSKSRSIHL